MAKGKYVGKYRKGGAHLRKRKQTKQRTTLFSLFLILSLAVSGTLAYIVARTDNVNNQFEPSYVTCQVNVNNDNSFDVTNTGDVNAFIRAAIVVNWMDEKGNVRGIAPSASDYTLSVNTADWWKDDTTGYYYYKYFVVPGDLTNDLITAYGLAENAAVPSGYELSVEVVAEAVQADGDTDIGNVPAYKDAWGIDSISGS